MAFDPEALLAKIHGAGYWRIAIRQSRFEGLRITSLAKCWEIMEGTVVSLRGWNYPHVSDRDRVWGQDWIGSGADFRGNIEYWQFFQSGQFVHHLAIREDHEALPYRTSAKPHEGPVLDRLLTSRDPVRLLSMP